MIINLPPFPTGAGALRRNGDTCRVQQQLQDMLLNTLSREEVCCKPCKSPLAVGSPIYIIQVFVLNAPQHINHRIRRAHTWFFLLLIIDPLTIERLARKLS